MNISEHTTNFIQEMKRRGMSQNSINTYSSCVTFFFSKSIKDHPKNINEQDIKDFLTQFDAPNTQRNYHSAIKKFYDICMNQPDKFRYIPYCQKSNKLPIVLSVEEVQKMFSVCENLTTMSCGFMNNLLSLGDENLRNIHYNLPNEQSLRWTVC